MVLKFNPRSEDGADASAAVKGASIRVVQVENSFPIGACISKSSIQNPAFVDFFTKHFDWAVFENELKWYHTEAVQGQLNYTDPDALLDFCDRHGKPVRGHCIFWAVDRMVQKWVKDLPTDQLTAAVQVASMVSWSEGSSSSSDGYSVTSEVSSRSSTNILTGI